MFYMQDGVYEDRWHSVHHEWAQLHEFGARDECRRHGRRASGVHQNAQDKMGDDDTQLWADMAKHGEHERPKLVIHGDH